jgi:hypothetical protein
MISAAPDIFSDEKSDATQALVNTWNFRGSPSSIPSLTEQRPSTYLPSESRWAVNRGRPARMIFLFVRLMS